MRASTLLKAMSNQHRLMILCQLVPGEKCVSELEEIIGLSQSALSQHLARLRRDNLVSTRREAQTILAAQLYKQGRLSLGQGAEVAGLSKRTFAEILGRYEVSIFNEEAAEIEKDMRHA